MLDEVNLYLKKEKNQLLNITNMNTREIYFKMIMQCELPVCRFNYTFKEDGVIKVDSITLSIREKDQDSCISYMKTFEKSKNGFMFWNNSIEAEEIYKNKN